MKDQDATQAKKKPGSTGNDSQAANQETLHEQTEEVEDPQAQDTIRYFIRDRLAEFHEQIENSLDILEADLHTQSEASKAVFNQRGFFDFIGHTFELELLRLGGGAERPFAATMVREVHNAVAFAEHSCYDLGTFVNNAFRRGVRDACWFLRDAAPSVLGAQWPDLLKLAANGSNQFIPALYTLGFPSHAFKPAEFAATLRQYADGYRRSMIGEQQRIEEQSPAPAKRDNMVDEVRKDMIQEGEKKTAVAS
jgi:hypothetical protein